MVSKQPFSVIIAGGGVAGLTLAIMLERFSIDYVLLEARSEIAPFVGASVALFPNGSRILDQLGCYEDIRKSSYYQCDNTYTQDKNGMLISVLPYVSGHIKRRHGYDLNYLDRQRLLKILHESIRNKDRILLNKEVTNITLIDGGVCVRTADKSIYTGTLIAGVDGIHSQVRSIMKTLANELEPGYISTNEENPVSCYYRCSFGIAGNILEWTRGDLVAVSDKGLTLSIMTAPEEDRVYWFLFEKLPEVRHGKDIPRYTKEDESDFVKRHATISITDKLTFGQLFAKRLSSTLTPLHEVVYKEWYFRRIIIFGDSAHKSNPIGGQGASASIESCAEFLNAILRKRSTRGGSLDDLSDEDVAAIFAETQSTRHHRAQMIVQFSHGRQAVAALEKPLLSFIAQRVIPQLLGDEFIFNLLGRIIVGASKLEHLPVPARRKAVPFNDELPAKPIDKAISRSITCALVGVMGLLVFTTTAPLRPQPLGASKSFLDQLRDNMPISAILDSTAPISSLIISNGDHSIKLRLLNFLAQMISPLLAFTVEGYRLRNQGTPLALPSLFAAGIQLQGPGRISLIHCILNTIFASESIPGRTVPGDVAMSLIPALIMAFISPIILYISCILTGAGWEACAVMWLSVPLLVTSFTALFSTGLRRWNFRYGPPQKLKGQFERYEKRDVPILKKVYTYAFALQATLHITSTAYLISLPRNSIKEIFHIMPIRPQVTHTSGLSEELSVLLDHHAISVFAGYICHNVYSIWDLRRLGYISSRSAVMGAISIIAGQILIGPGATWTGFWLWREAVIADLAQ